MKKILLQVLVPFVVGCSIIIAFGYPLGQSIFSGICAMGGMYLGQYLSKRRAAKKMNG